VRNILHVFDSAAVFQLVEDAGQVQTRAGRQRMQILPAGDQLFVERVELVAAGLDLLQPIPLHHRGLDQRGRSVGVVFEHFGRRDPVIGEVETPVDIGVAAPPRFGDPRPIVLGDVETAEIAGSH
jgi:hypothetical protein